MPDENEKKYLIKENHTDFAAPKFFSFYKTVSDLQQEAFQDGIFITQGYLPLEDGLELADRLDMVPDFDPVEARLRLEAGRHWFYLKSDGKFSRQELPKFINKAIFDEHWKLTDGQRIEKARIIKPYGRFSVEFDVYMDRTLIIAEVEVKSEKDLAKLIALGEDVTDDPKYKNKNLAK